MNPLLLATLLSGGTSLIGAMTQKDPRQQYLQQIMSVLNPQTIGQDMGKFFSMFQQNMMPGLTNQAISGTNTLRNQLATRLRGASGTGVGAVASSMANSSLSPQLNQYSMLGYQQAMQQANQLAQMRAGAFSGGPMPYNMGGQLFGAGLSGLGDILKMYIGQSGIGNQGPNYGLQKWGGTVGK